MACPLDHNALSHLSGLARTTVQATTGESECYGVLSEMLIEHRVTGSRPFILFPQLRLKWKPQKRSDRRANIPDMGIGRISPHGRLLLQGGAEQKSPTLNMQLFPDAADIASTREVREVISGATHQASDQVKSAIKNGALPHDVAIKWIIATGPYFCIREFGPFNEAELSTRAHRPNDSGDAAVAEYLINMKAHDRSTPLPTPLYRIGTQEAAIAMDGYLFSPEVAMLYSSVNRLFPQPENEDLSD